MNILCITILSYCKLHHNNTTIFFFSQTSTEGYSMFGQLNTPHIKHAESEIKKNFENKYDDENDNGKNRKIKNSGFTIFSDTAEKQIRSKNNDHDSNDSNRLNMSNFKPEKASFRHEIRDQLASQNCSLYLSSSNSTNGSSFSRNVTDNN